YAELMEQADGLANFLHASGVKRGDRVAVVLPKSIEAVVSLFGIMKAGAMYVPVDHAAPVGRSRKILVDCAIKALVVDSRSMDVVPEGDAPDLTLSALIVVRGTAIAHRGGPEAEHLSQATPFEVAVKGAGARPNLAYSSTDFAYILYTSGSTG